MPAHRTPLRRYLLAYAHAHNNRLMLANLDELAGYSRKRIATVVERMTNEGTLTRIKKGIYEVSTPTQHTT